MQAVGAGAVCAEVCCCWFTLNCISPADQLSTEFLSICRQSSSAQRAGGCHTLRLGKQWCARHKQLLRLQVKPSANCAIAEREWLAL